MSTEPICNGQYEDPARNEACTEPVPVTNPPTVTDATPIYSTPFPVVCETCTISHDDSNNYPSDTLPNTGAGVFGLGSTAILLVIFGRILTRIGRPT